MKLVNRMVRPGVLALAFLTLSAAATAASYSGTVAMLEIWPSGNVVFSLNGVALPCNGQTVINKSMPAVKNLYAALLAAKISGRQVMLSSSVCGPAEDYSPSVQYNQVDYLYVLD
jgi:hypothetical protein